MEWMKVVCSAAGMVQMKVHFSADEMVGLMGSSQVARSVAPRAARTVVYVVGHLAAVSAAAMAMMMADKMAAKRVAEKASSEVGMRAPQSVGKLVEKKDDMSGSLKEWMTAVCSVEKKV